MLKYLKSTYFPGKLRNISYHYIISILWYFRFMKRYNYTFRLQFVEPTTYPSAMSATTSVVEVRMESGVQGVTTRTTPGVTTEGVWVSH